MTEHQTPDGSLIASIEHQAEKLGYLVAQVEEMFRNRAQAEHHTHTATHAEEGTALMTAWLAKEIEDEEYNTRSVSALEYTVANYERIKNVHQMNINRLNQIVIDAINRGKAQQNELNTTLDEILSEGE
jgi:hypothetical protein